MNETENCYRCGKRHWSWREVARCTWPEAGQIDYSGPYALLLPCRAEANLWRYGHHRRALIVVLANDPAGLAAEAFWECGGACKRYRTGHDIVQLDCAPCVAADRRRVA